MEATGRKLVFGCCFCGNVVEEDLKRVILQDEEVEDDWQQWWAHEACFRERLVPTANVGKDDEGWE